MNSLKGFFYGIATSVTFGLIPLFTLPLMQKGMMFDFDSFLSFSLCHLCIGCHDENKEGVISYREP